ncbi:MAG: hypothetical protein SGPRY_009081, partial [Prymnesium sp.]
GMTVLGSRRRRSRRLLCALLLCGSLPAATSECANLHDHAECERWSAAGECTANPGFMRKQCARSCDSCSWRDTYCDKRNHGPAKGDGEIVASFERALTLPGLNPTVHSTDPYVVTFEDFVSEEEAQAFLNTTKEHFSRSLAGDVVSPVRTSEQVRLKSWRFKSEECSLWHQVLKYEPGQFYRAHHDQNTHPDSLAGVRLFTFFIYLQAPESGGQTYFPRLNITVRF